MTPISALFGRIALVHLMLGTTLGAALLAARGSVMPAWIWLFRSAHYELLLFGWMVQLAFAVAAWILPRSTHRRGNAALYVAFLSLNVGTVLLAANGLVASDALPFSGRLLQTIAVAVFAWYIWPRVRAFVVEK